MTIHSEQTIYSSRWYNHWITYLLIILILIIGIIGIYRINYLMNKRQIEVDKTVRQILYEQSQSGLLFPNVVLVNSKGTIDTSFNNIIKSQLANFLIEKYLSNKKNPNQVFDIQPYLNLDEKKTVDSVAPLSRTDIEQIKKHIEFLASTVDKAVDITKHEVDIEIADLNNWITIWLAAIGALAIFIPIVININSFNEIKSVKSKAKKIASNIKQMSEVFKTHQPQLENLPSLMKNVDDYILKTNAQSEKIALLDSQYSQVQEKAIKAEASSVQTEQLLMTVNSIFKLKDIDGNFLIYNKRPLETIVETLEEITIELSQHQQNHNQPIIKDGLRQLARRLYSLSYYSFLNREDIKIFIGLSKSIAQNLENGLDQFSYNLILSELNSLIKHFKKENKGVAL